MSHCENCNKGDCNCACSFCSGDMPKEVEFDCPDCSVTDNWEVLNSIGVSLSECDHCGFVFHWQIQPDGKGNLNLMTFRFP